MIGARIKAYALGFGAGESEDDVGLNGVHLGRQAVGLESRMWDSGSKSLGFWM